MQNRRNQPNEPTQKLRVLEPRTLDGNIPMLDENDRAVFKETWLPITAKPYLEARNEKLPAHLRMRLEIVDVEKPKKIEKKPAQVDEDDLG